MYNPRLLFVKTVSNYFLMNRTTNEKKPFGLCLLSYTLFIVLVVTLTPFNFHFSKDFPISWNVTQIDIITNIILFIPPGFMYIFLWGNEINSYCLKALFCGLMLSTFIEFLQLFLSGRCTSITDVMANGSGAWMGAFVCERLKLRMEKYSAEISLLEVPLVTIVYLLLPLLWINSLTIWEFTNSLWLSLMLGIIIVIIFSAIYSFRLKPTGRIKSLTLSVLTGMFFSVASYHKFTTSPVFTSVVAVSLSISFLLLSYYWKTVDKNNRRFEIPVLKMILPAYLFYMISQTILPLYPFTVKWAFGIGFSTNSTLSILQSAKHIGAFTILGYILAEIRGRGKKLPLWRSVLKLSSICLLFAVGFELILSFHPYYKGSMIQIVLYASGFIYGLIIYRLQLAYIFNVRKRYSVDSYQ